MANLNFPNSRIYSGHYFPVLIDMNFIVSATDTAGYGITNLKGAYVSQVYMHTSATPATGSPNPASGYIVIKLGSNYNSLLYYTASDVSPLTGSNVAVSGSSLTVGVPYTISVLGTSTSADWVTLGVPVGVTAAVGVSFIAAATGAGSGSGQVQLNTATGSGIQKYDMIQDPNQTMTNINQTNYNTAGKGAWLIMRALAATNSSTTTLVAAAPAAGTKINIQLLLSNTDIKLGGQ